MQEIEQSNSLLSEQYNNIKVLNDEKSISMLDLGNAKKEIELKLYDLTNEIELLKE